MRAGRISPAAVDDGASQKNKDDAADPEEQPVGGGDPEPLDDVVDVQEVVVDDPLDKVEDAPAQDQRADKRPRDQGTSLFCPAFQSIAMPTAVMIQVKA